MPDPGMTVAESVPTMPAVPRPNREAPNVVVIVLDDTGFAQLGCFGSDIATPAIDALAGGGIRFNRFHVTSLCSPTRACLLTGRNHHAVGMGFLADLPMAFPGYSGRLPRSAAPLPRVLRDAGYNTMHVGKWHLVPRGERSAAGPFERWPLGYGFERSYGFLQGDTNQWTPNLVRDNHYVEPPGRPEDGYHLSEDLADTAIRYVIDQQQAAPGKPFFMYIGLGAMHAPHHVAPSWVEPYEGRFDEGWDAWRADVFARQVAGGIVPDGSVLTERPAWVAAWDTLSADERRMHTRAMEVFAGFLTHTDAQIGRVVDALETLGVLDNTLVLLISDNGASAEGGELGTANEHRFTAQLGDTVESNLAALADWGGFRSYNHYSWGWAWAGNTPLRLWKRYTWLGGTRTPLIVHWPQGVPVRGEIRGQLTHVIDLMPTVLDLCGIPVPDEVDGVPQQPMDGASLRAVLSSGDAPDARTTQYFEMVGSRSIIHDGWKATTDHVSMGVLDEERLMLGSRDFATDSWSLFDLRRDFSEADDVAADHPETLRRLQERWLVEAGRNQVFPMDDGLLNRFVALIGPAWPPAQRSVFRPGGSPIHDESVPMLGVPFEITALVEVPAGAEGVLCALGDWNGGYALYVTGGRLGFTFSRGGDLLRCLGSMAVPEGRHRLGARCTRDGDSALLWVHHDGVPVGSVAFNGVLPLALQHGGAGLRLGYDAGFPVSDDYSPPAPWTGVLHEVVIDATGGPDPAPVDLVRAAFHAD
jgi:arylsulfatase A-like enzyme